MKANSVAGALLSIIVAAALVRHPPTEAQTLYASLVGNITDPSGAAVPSARITATNPQTGFVREAATDERGAFLFSDLPPGIYDVRISAASFGAYTRTGVSLAANTVVRADAQLELQTASQSISIAATAADLQTDRADVHTEMASDQVQNLPISGQRNYTSLEKLVPGMSPPKLQHSIVSNPEEDLVSNTNGADDQENNTRIDGASSSHIWLPRLSLYAPPLEMIESVNIVTNSMDAEQGSAGGAVVNVITKSGTNDLHAVAFEYNIDSALMAKNIFSTGVPKVPKYIQNQFGGAIGGAIKKNKLFYFLNLEETYRRWNASRWTTIPTLAERSGDLSAYGTTIYDPLTGNSNGTGRAPLPGNAIPKNRMDATALMLDSWLPDPTNQGATNNYYASGSSSFNRHNADAKVNWNPSDKVTMFGRFSILNFNVWSPSVFDKASGQAIDTSQQAGYGEGRIINTSVGGTYIVSPRFLIDASIGYGRMAPGTHPIQYGQNIGLDVLHLPGTNSAGGGAGPSIFYSGIPDFEISGYEGLGNPGSATPYFWHDNQYQYNANFTWIHGAHNIRWGLDVSREQMNHMTTETGAGPRGLFTYSGGVTALSGGPASNSFNAFAAYLMGYPSSVGHTVATEMPATMRAWREGYYVRDQWQVTRNLTATIGLRYEYYPLVTRAHRGIDRYDMQNNVQLLGGVGGVPSSTGVSVSHLLFAPRLGLAYRLGPKWVIRTGYGIQIDPYSMARSFRTDYPILLAMTAVADNSYQFVSPTSAGIPVVPIPDESTGRVPIAGTVSTLTLPDNYQRGYSQTYNFTVQRELPWSMAAQAGYVGMHGNMPVGLEENWAALGQGNNGRQLYSSFGRNASTTLFALPPASNDYNSLQTSLTRRFKGCCQMQVSYTYSKSISWAEGGAGGPGNSYYQMPSMYSMNRVLSSYDRPHNLNAAFTTNAPFGTNRRWARTGVPRLLLGGWRLNGILSRYSGTPFSVTASSTSLNTPGSVQTADLVKSSAAVLGGTGPGQSYFDPLAFASVSGVRFGDSGLNILRGPGVTNLDLGLFREFAVREKYKIQFRAEAFNSLNTPHFNNPGTNVSNMVLNSDGSIKALNGYTEITSAAQDQRQVRFGLRMSF